jgi:hypothetical protein
MSRPGGLAGGGSALAGSSGASALGSSGFGGSGLAGSGGGLSAGSLAACSVAAGTVLNVDNDAMKDLKSSAILVAPRKLTLDGGRLHRVLQRRFACDEAILV